MIEIGQISSWATNPKIVPEAKTLHKLQECARVTFEIIDNLSEAALGELLGGNSTDINNLYNNVFEQTYETLYGSINLVEQSNLFYLDNLAESMEETLRVESLAYFLTSCFPTFELNWHHVEWSEMAQLYRKLCIIAARDHGKSYFWSNVYPIWKMYRYRSKTDFLGVKPRRDLYMCERGALITNEHSLGEDLMEILKDTIEANEILREALYPEHDKARNWAVRKIKCKNGARLQIKSFGSKFRGRHPGYAVIDDFLDDSCLYSKERREKFINYFHSVIMNAVSKGGDVVVVGTPFHASDLYGDLKKKKNWMVAEYPSIMPEGRVLWPGRYDIYDLLEKRDDQGQLVFTREHLCRPVVSDSSIFPYDLVARAFKGMENYTLVKNRESFPIQFDRVVTGCDFALSANVGADYSVYMTWGIDHNNVMWLLNMYRVKGKSYREQIQAMKSIYRRFRPDLMYLESNQFQTIFVQEADKEGLPVMPHVTTGANKHDMKRGLPGLSILFERNKIRIPIGDDYSKNTADLITSELTSIAWTDKGLQGVGEHDDCAMAMWQSKCAADHVDQGFGIMM
jgi:hypothetical protein